MAEVMEGRSTPAQSAAFIVALRMKGESVEEMTGLVEAMYDAAVTVDVGEPVVDIVGTGGDGSGTFNISTTAAFIAAGAGAKVAKHGNRAASSQVGFGRRARGARGADRPARRRRPCGWSGRSGSGSSSPRSYHPAMRHAAPVRRELGIPTVFNVLGPLANPARARPDGGRGGRRPDGRADDRRPAGARVRGTRSCSTARTASTN